MKTLLIVTLVIAGALSGCGSAPAKPFKQSIQGSALHTSELAPLAARQALNRSLTAYQAQNWDLCIINANDAIKISPNYAEAYNNRAVARLMLKQYAGALLDARTAVQLKPTMQLARNNLVWIDKEIAKAGGDVPKALTAKKGK